MAPNRIMRGFAMRRALLLGAALAALAAGLLGCGGEDGDSIIDQDADIEVLNEVLGRQLGAVEAYGQVLPALRGGDLAMAREFRSQEQEHVNEVTKMLRGLEGGVDPVEEPVEVGDLETRRDAFEYLYELESATIDEELSAVGRLTLGWPRPVMATMAGNQAQRLVLIRRALGAKPLQSVPEAFETGEIPAPEGPEATSKK